MPTLLGKTLTAGIITRIGNAYGVTSNIATLETAIWNDIKNKVMSYESDQARITAQANVDAAKKAQETAVNTAIADVETNVQLT